MIKAPNETLHIQIVATPNLNMLATMGFIDPLRAANYLDGKAHFRWEFTSEHGGACMASNGAVLETCPLQDARPNPDFLIISSSWAPEQYATRKLQNLLRMSARSGATIGAIDTGAFILAAAGLLDGRAATVHYEHVDAFQELFPEVETREDLFVFDGNIVTCCGGSATVDLGLHILHSTHGPALANSAARYIFHPGMRDRGAPQQPEGSEPLGNLVPCSVRAAIRIMEENLEDPVPIPAICAGAGLSQRQLDRLFAQYIKKTPALYYRDIRLDRARGLVTQTEMPIAEVAAASGFASQVHFSRAYRNRFGLPPSRDRIEGRIPYEFRARPMHRRTSRDEASTVDGEK
ncbi:GlxA family transcriptional regulator [Rhodobacteraceae bacterium NNCM2]|nr:GlxA family transcriptional regulator [Coraliihabitans acroporae]